MTERGGGEREALAPVIPLFGVRDEAPQPAAWHATWIDSDEEPPAPPDEHAGADAETLLLRRLRTRSLSQREARQALATAGAPADVADAVVARFVDRGYLDDRALAEQLIDKALSRKAQGRQAIAQTLAQRGIPRELADEALAALPDDEGDRALDFARSKAPQLAHLDRDAALRRLAGQLARRGFGAAALSVARRALDEQQGSTGGVRFV